MEKIKIPHHIQAMVEAIQFHGGHTYLAGGTVRDHLMGISGQDYDLEVYGLNSTALEHILEEFGDVDAVGKSFGILLLNNQGYPSIEIGLPRRENKEGQGHKGFLVEVDPSMTTLEATSRRDFTMNSMLLDLHNGELIDHHNGLEDITCRILRATSKAYMEDPLRVLRGFQFVARFGLVATGETIAMSQDMLKEADTLSVERVWGEWYKWATLGESYTHSLEFLRDTGWISLYPELEQLKDIGQDPIWHPEGDVWNHTCIAVEKASALVRLGRHPVESRVQQIFAALLHDIGKAVTAEVGKTGRLIHPKHELASAEMAEGFFSRIGAPGWVGEKVIPMVREHMFRRGRTEENMTKRIIRRLSVRIQPATISELQYLILADTLGRVEDANPFVEQMMKLAAEIKVEDAAPEKILTGETLISKGLVPGPLFGTILRAAYEAQLDGEFSTHYGALVWLEQHLPETYENYGK